MSVKGLHLFRAFTPKRCTEWLSFTIHYTGLENGEPLGFSVMLKGSSRGAGNQTTNPTINRRPALPL